MEIIILEDSCLARIFTLHDCQLVDDMPAEKLLIRDVPFDIVCASTQVIVTNTTIRKPRGIYLLGHIVSREACLNLDTQRAQEQN
ncbi:hypothetical protein Peur_047125 [Populus x canadensis]